LNTAELYKLYLQNPSIQTDTRKLTKGDIFLALKGPHFNGNTFALQALNNGASYAIVDDPAIVHDKCIWVEDTLVALQQLAKHHRLQYDIPFIAITGSNGKTTTKELIRTVLKRRYKTFATEGNLNNHIGVPLTILKIKQDAEIAIIEMGANHLREIASYCEIAIPSYGIITNCGKAHIEGFGSEEGVRKGKGELYDFLRKHHGAIFRNTDLTYLAEMAKGIDKQITYGSANATYLGKSLMRDVTLDVAMLTKGTETTIHTQLVGGYNFSNVMAAVAVGLHFGISIDEIKIAIELYSPDNSRSQWVKKGNNNIILDAYNANPSSMQAAINNFSSINLPNKILWIGAMKEMGIDERKEHKQLVALIQQYAWTDVILVGNEFEGINGGYHWFENADAAAAYIKLHLPQHASILIKGSRGSKMEKMLEAL